MRSTQATLRPGSKNGGTTIVFRLAKGSLVRFTVVRVFPTCERVGAFRVRAHAGVNRVKFRGRLKGRPLEAGTYRLLVRARGASKDAAALKLVVVRGKPLSANELRKARTANVCDATSAVDAEAAAAALGGSSTSAADGSLATGDSSRDSSEGLLRGTAGKISRGAEILGARFATAAQDPSSIQPIVWGVLGLAILLLALAALPSGTLANARAEAIAYKRVEVALAGTAALGAAFLVYLIG